MSELQQVATFEIDARNWTRINSVGFFDPNRDYQEFTGKDPVWKFLKHLSRLQGSQKRKREYKIICHSSENYNNILILRSLHRHGQHPNFDPFLMHIKWVDKNITFENTWKILPFPLSSLIQAFNVKLDLNPSNLVGHPEGDCLILSKVYSAFAQLLFYHFGIPPSMTLANTAMNAFNKRFNPLPKKRGTTGIWDNKEWEREIRAATYGGRNEIYRQYGENLFYYDIHSMYLSCYNTPVPVGRMEYTKPDIYKGTLAEAKVKVPSDFYIGPLPYNLEGRLIFPVGEFQGWWDTRELRYAASLGCDITVLRQLKCEEVPILDSFGKFVCDQRYETQSKSMQRVWKQFGILLYGKFGQQGITYNVKHGALLSEEDFEGTIPVLETNEEYYLVPNRSYEGNRKPAISMRIRAEARIRHLEYLLSALDKGPIYYCDTDSIFCSNKMETTDEPGGLGYVDYAVRAYFLRQKFYGYIRPSGKLVQRTAGYAEKNLKERDLSDCLYQNDIELVRHLDPSWQEVINLKEALGEAPLKRKTSYTISGESPIKTRVLDGTDTYPVKLPLESTLPSIFTY